MEIICKGCKKLFERNYNAQKFCSYECQYNHNEKICGKGHYVKPDGWVYHGVCPWCGKQFISDRKKIHCSDECGYQHTLQKARDAREKPKPPCKYCGGKLSPIKKTFCSDECKHKYYRKTDKVPLTFEIISARITERYDNIELIRGNKSDGLLVVKCKVCGGEFQIGEKSTRIIPDSRIRVCPHCIEAEKLFEREATKRNQLMNRLVFLLKKREKYLRDTESRKKCCIICGNEFIPQHGNILACSEICTQKQKANAKKQSRHTRKARKKCNGEIDRSISLERLIMRDKNTCHICGHKCNSHDFVIDANGSYIAGANHPSIDHVMPLSKGGSHTWGNIKLAHHRCNTQKSDLLCYERCDGQMALAI